MRNGISNNKQFSLSCREALVEGIKKSTSSGALPGIDLPLPPCDLLSRAQVSMILGVTKQTVDNYVRRGLLRTYRIGARTLFSEDEVRDKIRSGELGRYLHSKTTREVK